MSASAALGLARSIAGTLRQHGHQAYFVGGCVRDLLLKREPKDYDVATDATPDQAARLFPRSERVGAHFGVLLVKGDDVSVEVATFRSDGEYKDGRRPDEVRFETDPRQDVWRRDFTVNGLLLDPVTAEVLDFVHGREDLQAGVIRAIGEPERRFREDHLRLLRAVRFAARLQFAIEPGTLGAMRRLAPLAVQVAAERTREELTRILTEGGARRGFELLNDTGLLDVLLPEVAAMRGVEQPPEYHPEGDVWVHTLLLLEHLDRLPAGQRTCTLAWGTLLHDVGKPPTFERAPDRIRFSGHAPVGAEIAERICQRLRFAHGATERIVSLVAQHMKFGDVRQMRESTLKRFLRQPHFDEQLELHRLDCSACHNRLELYDFVRERLAQMPQEELRPPRLVTGHDLLALGVPKGPALGELLREIEDAQLEGAVRTKEEALELARQRRGP